MFYVTYELSSCLCTRTCTVSVDKGLQRSPMTFSRAWAVRLSLEGRPGPAEVVRTRPPLITTSSPMLVLSSRIAAFRSASTHNKPWNTSQQPSSPGRIFKLEHAPRGSLKLRDLYCLYDLNQPAWAHWHHNVFARKNPMRLEATLTIE